MNAPRCDNWHGMSRCDRQAETHLITPEGKALPGGDFCLQCATACIEEYAEKLHESWTHDPARNVGFYQNVPTGGAR